MTEKTKKKVSRAALEKLIVSLNKKYGGDIIFNADAVQWEREDTGLHSLNYVLGGGLLRGGITEFQGPPSTFKTSLALYSAATLQRKNPDAVITWAMLETPPTRSWARTLGVRVPYTDDEQKQLAVFIPDAKIRKRAIEYHARGNFYYISAPTGDTTLDAVLHLAKMSDLVVIDSMSALMTQMEQDKSVDEKKFGDAPIVINTFLRKLTAQNNAFATGKSVPAIITINQLRTKIGGRPNMALYDTTGGMGLKYFKHYSIKSSITGKVRRKSGNSNVYASEFTLKNEKAKMSVPFLSAIGRFIHTEDNPIGREKGFDTLFDLVNMAKLLGIIQYRQGKGWFAEDTLVAKKQEDIESAVMLDISLQQLISKYIKAYYTQVDLGLRGDDEFNKS